MPLIVTVNTTAECLRTDCNILGDKINKKETQNVTLPVVKLAETINQSRFAEAVQLRLEFKQQVVRIKLCKPNVCYLGKSNCVGLFG